ncbi:multidrug DMT transporter [Acinetobacter sp. ANC 4470]|uniref:DNA circularization protein n=1 Tax=Acinetobacter sp. ANC 4470 TaxID=1977881 RepID=UPI000A33BFE2|nr:DNA circularization N-terminal domain-containing protein [Acinetobacter sp. ANC 4470]OTG68314.1 multidrug DMT transporter [Acinetobacter sp. ANC 4470]
MGWATELHDASFRGVQFECTTISDSMSKTVSIQQAPYSNYASVEDMGNEPRRISIQAIYAGNDYLIWLNALLAALEESGSGELIHPIFGICNAQVVSHNVNHDADNYDACLFTIEFVIAQSQKKQRFIPVKTQNLIQPIYLVKNPALALKQALEKLKLNDNNAFFNVINKIRTGLDTVRNVMGLAKNTIENILSPDTWATGLIDDITKLVTFDTSISAISKWRDVVNRIQRFDLLFDTDDSQPEPEELKQLWRATQVASVIAITQSVVATVRNEMAQNQETSFTPVELAVIRQQNRQTLQQVINIEREQIVELDAVSQIQIYKDVADQIHLQIQELIEIHPPITTAKVEVPCTLHWLAHYLYEDMNRASEIRRLNPDLVNPAVLRPGMEVTVYAR